jgi:hypothetical protein
MFNITVEIPKADQTESTYCTCGEPSALDEGSKPKSAGVDVSYLKHKQMKCFHKCEADYTEQRWEARVCGNSFWQ